MATSYRLISFDLCPFVQRSIITLNEKAVPFDLEYIDLKAKPDWFMELSPLGKVPVLQVGDTVLFESAVINEYLDEVTEGSMIPSDPLQHAHARAWIEFSSNLTVDVSRMIQAKDDETFSKQTDRARGKLEKLEKEVSEDGPFFYGAELTLVDCAVAPALMRLSWMEKLDPELSLICEFPKICRWREALCARPSVRTSVVPDIEQRFHKLLKGNESYVGRALP